MFDSINQMDTVAFVSHTDTQTALQAYRSRVDARLAENQPMRLPAAQVARVHDLADDRPRVVEAAHLNVTLSHQPIPRSTAAVRARSCRPASGRRSRQRKAGRRRSGGRYPRRSPRRDAKRRGIDLGCRLEQSRRHGAGTQLTGGVE